MTKALLTELRARSVDVIRNPHLWVVLTTSAILLVLHQAWPWSPTQLAKGIWRHFPWLSGLQFLVINVEFKYHLLGALFLIPIVYGSLTLSWPGGILAWGLALVWLIPTLHSLVNAPTLINLALLLLPVLIVVVINGERRWRERERRYFAERERERQTYIAKLVEAEEAERRRIAQELHDETLQTLMVIANKSDALAQSGTETEQTKGNRWIKHQVLQTMDDLRRLSMNLRPAILDNFGLVSGVRWLVNDANNQNGCRLQVSVEGEERRMSSLSEVTVFRVVQEAITNIQRHSLAKEATVRLRFEADRVVMQIEDDGVGFERPVRLAAFVSRSKLGVMGMEQRILSVGGEVRIESIPGQGTRIWAAVPYGISAQVVEGEDA